MHRILSLIALALAGLPAGGAAQTLPQAFEAAWARQPAAAALQARREAAHAQQQATRAWTPEPAALELAARRDSPGRNGAGTREYEAGVAVPLWLPGERARSRALADAEGQAVESGHAAAQLRLAASVREAWWAWLRARSEAQTAAGQLDNAHRIAADVARRLKAGDVARADQHQADGALAAAESTVAQADAMVVAAQRQLSALTGWPAAAAEPAAGAEPEPTVGAVDAEVHGEIRALSDRAAVAERAAALAAAQSRANPELLLATTRERSAFGEAYNQTVTVGVRIPFGGGPRHEARQATARADALELQSQLALERARVAGGQEAARASTEAARTQLAAALRRQQLARESRGFFDKSFQLGQTDLPTRLRIEAEAVEAERQAAHAHIELAAAISAWRQALGLLPQ